MTTRHDHLIAAGWRYDARVGRYTAPDAPQDGTAASYSQDAAWEVQQVRAIPLPRPRRPLPDPRQQEPQ